MSGVFSFGLQPTLHDTGAGKQKSKKVHLPSLCLPEKSCKIVQVRTGGLFSAALSDQGEVLTWGVGKKGRLGLGDEFDHPTPTPVTALRGVKIVSIACGNWHAGAVSDCGDLYMWGSNKKGELGIGSTEDQTVPIRVPLSAKVAQIGCGHQYTIVLTEDGSVYAMGSNASGELGAPLSVECSTIPIKTGVSIFGVSQKAVQVSCGYHFCGVVTECGQLYMWGSNADGNIPTGTIGHSKKSIIIPTPHLIPNLEGEKIVKLGCSVGDFHLSAGVVCESGKAFMWGSNYKAKLGLGDYEDRGVPTLIQSISTADSTAATAPAAAAAAPRPKSAAVKTGSKTGGSKSEDPLPESSRNVKFVDINLGGIHSGLLTNDNCLYTFGCGSDGRTGHPESSTHRYLFRETCPRFVEALGPKVVDFSCSYYHTLALVR